MKYRAELRGFDLTTIEDIVRHSAERYYDMVTHRLIVVGRHKETLVLVPYERHGDIVTPMTVHVTTRQQITFRLRTKRFRYE